MQKVLPLVIASLLASGLASAATIVHEFTPTPADIDDLYHNYAYTWGVGWDWDGEVLDSATLCINNLNDWDVEPDDVLYIHLLDEAPPGVTTYWDPAAGDRFTGQGILLTTYTDPDTGPNPAVNWSYEFTPADLNTLASYLAGGFGLAFDPDCHYYNDGVKLTIVTHTPEPAGLLIACLAAVPFLYRKRR